MRHKRLVLDANIPIRAVLGRRVRDPIERYCDTVALYVAEANAEEAEFYLSKELAAKRWLSEDVWRPVYDGVLKAVQLIADDTDTSPIDCREIQSGRLEGMYFEQ